jgi:hypothetical protein
VIPGHCLEAAMVSSSDNCLDGSHINTYDFLNHSVDVAIHSRDHQIRVSSEHSTRHVLCRNHDCESRIASAGAHRAVSHRVGGRSPSSLACSAMLIPPDPGAVLRLYLVDVQAMWCPDWSPVRAQRRCFQGSIVSLALDSKHVQPLHRVDYIILLYYMILAI